MHEIRGRFATSWCGTLHMDRVLVGPLRIKQTRKSMKRIGVLLGYVTVVYVATLTIEQCKSEVTRPSLKSNTTVPIDPEIANRDDEDDFVPYRGTRSDVFDWMLFRTTSKRNPGNLLLSPISLKVALVLLYEGAQDETAHQIAHVIQLPATPAAIRDRFSTILRSLQATSLDYKLNIGTRIYADSNILIRQRYKAIAETFYKTNVITANLSDAHSVVTDVNAWVSNVTDGNIDRMIEDEDRVKDSLMLIMNALFFKGSWRRKYFSPEDTRIKPFHTSNNRTVNVPFMHAVGRFYYSESSELDAKILRIPYHGHKFVMYLLLPRTRNGIEQLVNEINPYILTQHVWLMQDLPVSVSIPKFKFEFTSHLEPILREVGISEIFDNTATLTGIAFTKRTSKHLQVSNILQKAGIEVNENGTTAYAATEVELVNKMDDQSFHANHPFLFYIEDESTGTILYMGKITDPFNGTENTTDAKQKFPSKIGTGIPDTDSSLKGFNTDDRNNLFNTYFLQALNREHSGNLISSPASIKTALTMLMEGAGGNTKTEIISILRLPEDESLIKNVMQHILKSLKRNENGTEIDLATCLWVDKNLHVLDNYKQILQSYYEGDIQHVDFSKPESAVHIINDWVQRATRNKVSSPLLNNVQPNTRLVLTSTIYFKGRWLKSFDKTRTKLQCFYTPNDECKNTYFMIHNSVYRYVRVSSIEADVLEIPYSDGKTVMLAITPSQPKRDPYLRILSKDLATVPVSAILSNLMERDVTIHVPKFTIENNLNLISTLQDLGIESIFKSNANLTKIVPNGSLQVTNILQNVKVEIDEEGTLAAADTEIGIEYLSSFGNDVKLDRPFLFLIVDSVTRTTLFSGRFMEPL